MFLPGPQFTYLVNGKAGLDHCTALWLEISMTVLGLVFELTHTHSWCVNCGVWLGP